MANLRNTTKVALALGALALLATPVRAQTESGDLPGPLREVGFEQRLGEELPLDTVFRDETGQEVRLGDFFTDRPVVLALVYFECPMLCQMILDGLVSSLDILTFTPGNEYEVVVVSFDPREDHVVAAAKKRNYMTQFGRPGTEAAFHFLTGEPASIDALTQAVGFSYVYDAEKDEFAHASGITVVTGEGRISRYLFGIEYPPKDLRLALVESAQMKIGSAVDQLLLFCYNYDPTTGKYGAATMRLVQAGGVVTVLALLSFIVLARRRDQQLTSASNQEHTER
jgi:protein SCO1